VGSADVDVSEMGLVRWILIGLLVYIHCFRWLVITKQDMRDVGWFLKAHPNCEVVGRKLGFIRADVPAAILEIECLCED